MITIEQLRSARGLLGCSQTELASRAGLSLYQLLCAVPGASHITSITHGRPVVVAHTGRYSYLRSHAAALHPLDAFAQWCACTSRDTLALVTANVIAWVVAVSGSNAMNSFITFAAESGRRLRWLDYGTFVASGILGAIANTTALVIAAQFMPVLPAKGCAILTSFAVNFSMSHFVVFRPRRKAAARTR